MLLAVLVAPGAARAQDTVRAPGAAGPLAPLPQRTPPAPPPPLPVPVQPTRGDTLYLSVEAAVERAVRTSDEVRLAVAQLEVTEAQLLTARGSVFPQLRVNAGYTRTIESARGQSVNQLFNQPNTYTVNAAFSQPLFQGGREWSALRAASRVRGAARLTAEEQRTQIALDVQRAYLDALFANRLLEIQQTNYQLAAERQTQVEQFQTAGRAARYDVLRARVERSNLEPLVIEAANQREIALLELKRLLDVPPEQPVALTTAVDPVGVQTMLASYARDTLLSDVPDRPSVQAAELTAQARRLGVKVARADLLPTVSVFLNWGYQAFPVTGSPLRWGDVPRITLQPGEGTCPGAPSTATCTVNGRQNGGFFSDRSAGVQFSWALFDGFRTKGNIDLAQAQARQAEIQLDLERERVSQQVAQARAELSRARALFEARRQNVGEADEAFRLASLRFTRGLSTQIDVSDAQYALLTASTNEARAVYDLYLAQAALARALGRPIPLPPARNATPPIRTSSNSSGSER